MIEDAEKNIEPIAPANEQRNLELASRIVASYPSDSIVFCQACGSQCFLALVQSNKR